MPLVPALTRTALLLLSAVAPHGGQGTARRNAWAAMAADAARARARREAAAALALAASPGPAATTAAAADA